MKPFILPGTDLRTSPLGFGCASIMGRQGRRKSLNALACAYDNGIIHFDVARSYGFGEAEKIVGEFIHNKRDKVCLVTKFGILPHYQSRIFRLTKPIVRALLDVVPKLRNRVRRSSTRLLAPGNFSTQTARNSLHTSLRCLRTETIDALLLHDCDTESSISDDLFDFLDRCVEEGKIRHYGLATDAASANGILESRPISNLTVIQTQLTPAHEYRHIELNEHVMARIVHSIGMLQPILTAKLDNAPTLAVSLPEEISAVRLRSPEAMTLLLRYASHKSRGGVTLMSSFTPRHIIENARSIEKPLSNHAISALDRLLLATS